MHTSVATDSDGVGIFPILIFAIIARRSAIVAIVEDPNMLRLALYAYVQACVQMYL